MNFIEFKNYIESIGFNSVNNDKLNIYKYKSFIIDLWIHDNTYDLYSDLDWFYDIQLNDLKPLHKYFKKELRSIKLKKILYL